MMWMKGRFWYHGTIVHSISIYKALKGKGKISVYAMPVPDGKIVNFERYENEHGIDGYRALYKVNVRINK